VDLTPQQARLVGCLIEKAATTPDGYPLSSNALVNACNQTTNRDPVVEYGERDIDAVMLELREMKLARTVTGSGHRVGKHKHVVDETLGLDGRELAVLAILLLRGPQTLNEISTRTERYADGPGGDRAAADAAIDRLAARTEPLVIRLARQPGEREPRIDQLWAATDDGAATPTAQTPPTLPSPSVPPPASRESPESPGPPGDLESRVATLEAELAVQTGRIDDLLAYLGE
jgi:uncharacterized protein